MAKLIGVDVGYSTVRVVSSLNPGDYKSESAVIAISVSDGSAVACGDEAIALSERVPGSVTLVKPFSGEMTPEPQYITAYFSYIVKRMKLKGASLALSISGSHDEETEGIYVNAIQKAGIGRVAVIDPVYAAACGCKVKGARNSAIVNIGASVTDMGCFEKGEQTAAKSNAFAGNAFDRAIISKVLADHKCRPSLEEAEKIKLELLSLSGDSDKTLSVTAIRPGLGLPKKVELTSKDVFSACEGVFESLTDEISDMIRDRKIEPDKVILTGGGAKINGLVGALTPHLLIPVEIAEEPELSVIRGLEGLLSRIK